MLKRVAYMLLGYGIGTAGALGVRRVVPFPEPIVIFVAILAGILLVAFAERKGKVQSVDELTKPISLSLEGKDKS